MQQDNFKLIPLTQGCFAKVDAEDYEKLNQFKWRVQKGRPGSTSYAARMESRRTLLMHRVILGAGPGQITDHANRDGLDNRRCNLRLCTQSENLRNTPPRRNKKTSQFKGVSRRNNRNSFRAICRVNDGKESKKHSRDFKSEILAAKAYDDLAVKYDPIFSYINFPHRLKKDKMDIYINSLKGRIIKLWYIKADGSERKIVCRAGVKKYEKGTGMRYDPADRDLVSVYDLLEKKYVCLNKFRIEAAWFQKKVFRVD